MSRIEELIAAHCPDGVPFKLLGVVAAYSDTRIDAIELDETTFVGVDNLLSNKGGRVDASYLPNTERLTAYQIGDVLLGNIRPYLKKVWLATNDGGCSGDVLALRVSPGYQDRLLPEMLFYLLSSDDFFAYDTQHARGGKMPRGDKASILRYRIPIPPVEVQHEIVRILDLFTELQAELGSELEKRRQQYSYYRDDLVPSTDRGQVSWVPLGSIAEFRYGFTTSARETGDYRFLRITDINQSGKLSPDGAKYVDGSSAGVLDYVVKPGDLLVARTGATYGKTMLVTSAEPAVYASFLIRIRFSKPVMLPAYYWHFAQSRLYWTQANALVSTGGQPQFNANVLKVVKVPVPSLDEQECIVATLDKFDALANDLSIGLPAELTARRKQYEYYRDRLLTFKELAA